MVEIDEHGRVRDIVDKPAHTQLTLMWGMAAWSPRFNRFLHGYLSQLPPEGPECVLSDVFLASLASQLDVQALVMHEGRYTDIGTPEDVRLFVSRQQQFVP